MNKIKTEEKTDYVVSATKTENSQSLNKLSSDETITEALKILKSRLKKCSYKFISPESVKNYLKLSMVELEEERFDILLLNNKHELINHETLFTGTINNASVYPRVIVKKVLSSNAAAVILAHNHPSCDPEPSFADDQITSKISTVLELIDVTVLDHFIVGGMDVYSYAEHRKI